jgi:CDP-glucose 4,6-dehydratase
MEALVTDGFWRGRKVFLTGHTGFKGSWLALWLRRLGAQVTGYALAPESDPALFTVLQPWPGLHSVIADLRDHDRLSAELSAATPELVIHMAAQPLVLRSYAEPVATFDINVMGTVHVLEAVRRSGVPKAVLVITTDKVYRNADVAGPPFREDAPLGSSDPYSSSKAAAELVAACYHTSFLRDAGIALATARAGNVIGGGDWGAYRLIPDLVRGAVFGTPVAIRYPDAIRPWQHVLDALYGYLLLSRALLERPSTVPPALNFGPDADAFQPVRLVSDLFLTRLGTDFRPSLHEGSKAHEAPVLTLDNQLARETLGWTPRFSLSQALERTAHWYGQFAAGHNPNTLCADDLSSYETPKP